MEYAAQIEQQLVTARGIVAQATAAPIADHAPSLEQLRAERVRLVEQKETATQRLMELQEQRAAAPERIRQLEASAGAEITQIRGRQEAIQRRLDTERLSTSQRTQLEGELMSLQSQRRALEHAQSLISTRVSELEGLVTQARGQIDGLNNQIRQLNRQIAEAERALQSRAEAMPPASVASVAVPTEVVAALRGVPAYRPRDQYERALRDMEVLERQASGDSERVSSSVPTSYC
jgi:chromosome segregation ATPase